MTRNGLGAMGARPPLLGYAAALGSAALVGLFTVLNKWLLTEAVPPLAAGAWTYLAAGTALLPWAWRAGGLRLHRPWVFTGWLLAGAVVGPSLYFLGLRWTSGVKGVLLINLEAVFTAVLAFAVFGERLTLATLVGGLAVLAGGVWLSWPDSGDGLLAGSTGGNLLIAAGYLGWATENNLGRLLGREVPAVTLVCLKAFAAAAALALLAVAFGQRLPVPWAVVPGILASGAVALGLSLALFYLAMQRIGAGRTGLLACTSSLWGVVAALVLLREPVTAQVLGPGVLMLAGLGGFAWETSRAEAEGAPSASKIVDG